MPVLASGGSNVTTMGASGQVDTVLFRWPGTAKANALGKHTITVRPGYHTGILGSQHSYFIGMPETVWSPEKTFTVTLV